MARGWGAQTKVHTDRQKETWGAQTRKAKHKGTEDEDTRHSEEGFTGTVRYGLFGKKKA